MSTLAIVLCAAIFTVAAANASHPIVERFERQSEQALELPKIIMNPDRYLSNSVKSYSNINEVLAASLWEKSKDFLWNDAVAQKSKNIFQKKVQYVVQYIQINLGMLEEYFKSCARRETYGKAISCYTQVEDNAYAIATKLFPELNDEINKLLADDNNTNRCSQRNSTTAVYIGKRQPMKMEVP